MIRAALPIPERSHVPQHVTEVIERRRARLITMRQNGAATDGEAIGIEMLDGQQRGSFNLFWQIGIYQLEDIVGAGVIENIVEAAVDLYIVEARQISSSALHGLHK